MRQFCVVSTVMGNDEKCLLLRVVLSAKNARGARGYSTIFMAKSQNRGNATFDCKILVKYIIYGGRSGTI